MNRREPDPIDERQKHVTRLLLVPILLGLATIALAACGADDEGDGTPVTDPAPPATLPPATLPPITEPLDLAGREFLVTGVDGYDVVDGTTIRVTFEADTLSINAGCNTIFGDYEIAGDRLIGGEFATTEMGCEPDLMAQDRWITDIMSLEPRLELDGDTLTITGVAGTVLTLLDLTVADPDRPLEGVRWVLDGIRTQDAVSTVPQGVVVSITFKDGRALVEAGCNTGSAGVTIADDTIEFGALALTRMLCEPDAMEVEALVSATLAGEVTYQIDADRLTIDSADTLAGGDADEPSEMVGTGLLFVADEG